MTDPIRTTRNSRTKILAAGPARILAAGSNAGKTLAGGSGLHKNETLRYPAVSSSFRRPRAHRRTAAFAKSSPQPPSRPQGWPQSTRGYHPERSKGFLFDCNIIEQRPSSSQHLLEIC